MEQYNIYEPTEPEFYIGKIFNGTYPATLPVWCKENNAMVREIDPIIEQGDEGEIIIRRYEIIAMPEPTPPTNDEIKEMRAVAYQQEVDPITSHIQRLRDKEQTPEIVVEIEQLIAERDEKVVAIKERFPYHE